MTEKDYITAKEIYAKLNGLELYPEYVLVDGPIIKIGISWGDWKHDHMRLDYIMESNFSVLPYKVVVTEEDGSDCYSAKHYYMVIEEETENE